MRTEEARSAYKNLGAEAHRKYATCKIDIEG
jgi:hypothetical protein